LFNLEGQLQPSVISFVERHVSSLLTWDVLSYFHSNSKAAVEVAELASLLGRRVEELEPEIRALCDSDILHDDGGFIRYRPSDELAEDVAAFAGSCRDGSQRLALIALVLQARGQRT
jgi:hypothetical protein